MVAVSGVIATVFAGAKLKGFLTGAADGYLDGLNTVKADFESLLKRYSSDPKCLFVLDPPYICTEQGMYANNAYFGMVEFLRLMRMVRPPFVFFSSARSELIEYLDFVVDSQAENH